MPYDQHLADRIRELLEDEPDVAEKKMFGGLAFLIAGNMAISASGHGGIMVRVEEADTDGLIAAGGARIVEMRGRPMRGWLRVDADEVATEPELRAWARRGIAAARKRPVKNSQHS